MKAQDLSDQMFGEFDKWLKDQEINVSFSIDLRMNKAWDFLFNQYSKEMNAKDAFANALKKHSNEDMEAE